MYLKRTEAEWIDTYQGRDGLWIHDGNPLRPHALLTSKKHSNGFFDSQKIIVDEWLLREAAHDLLMHLVDASGGALPDFDVVVGPATGATKLAELICELVNEWRNLAAHIADSRINDKVCLWMSPKKHEEDGVKSMVFTPEEIAILSGKKVLMCEDVISTGGSIDLAASAVIAAGGEPLRYFCTLVNRSGQTTISNKRIIALINRSLPMWEPHECPLCPQGSEAIRPKELEGKNWARLTAQY